MQNKAGISRSFLLSLTLLTLFFVFHGLVDNYDFVSMSEALLLWAEYLLASALLFAISYTLFRNKNKAAIFSFGLMMIQLFFGSIVDSLHRIPYLRYAARYSVLLAFILVVVITMFIWLKRKPAPSPRLALYLNCVLALFLLIDVIQLVIKDRNLKHERFTVEEAGFKTWSSSANADIFFLLFDEYAGSNQLRQELGFDNGPFERELQNRRFLLVKNSTSNYLSTPLSVASILDMNYIDFKKAKQEQDRVLVAYKHIRSSPVTGFLQSLGYSIHNHSIFDLPGQKSKAKPTFLPTGTSLVSSQTLTTRIKKDLGYHLYTTFGIKSQDEKYIYTDLANNNAIYENTIASIPGTGSPKFVYTHLMMPHYPYYFDSLGKQRPIEQLRSVNKTNQGFYLQYLQWCNQKILQLVDNIQSGNPGSIVILMSDHGFRAYDHVEDERPQFSNLCALYLPSQDYRPFYDGISGVNLFRVLFNTEFGQQLPLIRDSCVSMAGR